MRIVHVVGYIQPEMGYEEHYTAKWQAKLGHEVHVVTSDRIYYFQGLTLQDRYKGEGVFNESGYKIHRLKTVVELPSELIFVKGLGKKLKELHPKIVHIHGGRSPMQAEAAYLSKKYKYKLFADHHEFGFDSLQALKRTSPMKYLVLRAINKLQNDTIRKWMTVYSFKKARKVIPLYEGARKHLIEVIGVKQEKIFFNPLGADVDVFKFNADPRKKVREKFGFSSHDFVLIYVAGSMHRYKRIESLIETFLKLKTDRPSKLIIIGRGDKDYIEKLKGYLCYGKDFFLLPLMKKEELYTYYSAADVAVWINNISVSILEAMACELPIIVPDLGIGKSLVRGNGFLIEKGNIYQALTKLSYIYNLPIESRRKMGKRSREIILRNYSYERVVKNLIEIYEQY